LNRAVISFRMLFASDACVWSRRAISTVFCKFSVFVLSRHVLKMYLPFEQLPTILKTSNCFVH
jgi:hypothetical protein